MKYLLVIFIAIICYFFRETVCNEDDDDLVVSLIEPNGRVRGHTLKTVQGKEYYAFQEIPYAVPPIGRHRFQVPKRHNDWHGILDAHNNTKICMQTLEKNPFHLNITEDCLYLNIYTPQKPGSSETLLPVLLWIHPGDFISGAGVFQYYNPQYFIDYDVMVVTINYRLGPFGFLWTMDEIIPGNIGLRDQIFAFYWLFTNIMAFGGDPFRMTLVGQGSGAASVSYHYVNSRARESLFSGAIMQSGSSVTANYFQPHPLKYANKMAKALDKNYTGNSTQDLRDLLVTVPAEDILKAGEEIMEAEPQNGIVKDLVWLPVVEKYWNLNAYIVWEMLDSWSTGTIRITEAMVGFNSEEMIKWSNHKDIKKYAEKYDNDSNLLVHNRVHIPYDKRELAGNEIKKLFTQSTFQEDIPAFIKFLSSQVKTPIIKQAYNSSWYNINYIYQFSYKGDLGGASNVKEFGAINNVAHGEELKYMWDDGTNSDPSKFSKSDRLMQQRLLTLWTNFIKHQNPTPKQDELLDNVEWKYIGENKTSFLNINLTMEYRTHLREFELINDILDKYVVSPLAVF